MAFERESFGNVVFIAVAVSLVCSILVSGAAIGLRPLQKDNKELDRIENILRAAGMLEEGRSTDDQGRSARQIFASFEVRAVDLATGRFVDDVDTATYDPVEAARQPDQSRKLDRGADPATLGRLENTSLVYILRKQNGDVNTVVMPVRGYGLWGTLYGYLALEGDLRTVAGLGFYKQKETPGLGGEVDNPAWKSRWPGVQVFDSSGDPAVRLVKVRSAQGSSAADHEVDALSGATLTTRGVENLVNFWLGDRGFGPFLKQLAAEA